MRIVSLLPSATEIVHALGAGPSLVGRSEECDYPTSVRTLPIVMRAKTWDADRPSSEIDDRVRTVRAAGASLYELDLPMLSRLRPDVVFTQDLCGVCSVTEEEVGAACRAAGVDPQIVSLTPRTLEEVWGSVEAAGTAISRSKEAAALASDLRRRSAPSAPAGSAVRPKVAVVEWMDPPILAGLWTPDAVAAAGGRSVEAVAGAPGVRTSWSALADARPDLVLLSPCSFSVERTRRELETARIRSEAERVHPPLGLWLADEAYFSRPGPRLADGVALLRDLLVGRAPRAPMPVERWVSRSVAT
ncbi:MAG TPA: cobalamin-binding protein [Thermoplasmata archaeon]